MNRLNIILAVVGLLASNAQAMSVANTNCPGGCPSGSQCVWNGACTASGNCAHYCSVNSCSGSYLNMIQVSCQSGQPCVYRAECSSVSGGLNPFNQLGSSAQLEQLQQQLNQLPQTMGNMNTNLVASAAATANLMDDSGVSSSSSSSSSSNSGSSSASVSASSSDDGARAASDDNTSSASASTSSSDDGARAASDDNPSSASASNGQIMPSLMDTAALQQALSQSTASFPQLNTASMNAALAQLQAKPLSLDVKGIHNSLAAKLKFTPPTFPGLKPLYVPPVMGQYRPQA